jgi:hypothetical protein
MSFCKAVEKQRGGTLTGLEPVTLQQPSAW